MKERLLIFGTSAFSKEVMHYIEEEPEKYDAVGFVVDQAYYQQETFCGKKVYIFEKLAEIFDMNEVKILPSMGYSDMNEHRKKLFERCLEYHYKIGSYIHSSVVNRAKKIGVGNIILDDVHLSYDCIIGDGNIIKTMSRIAHDTVVGDFNFMAGRCDISGCVNIGSQNFFGVASLVRTECNLGDKNLIGATAYLDTSIGDVTVVSPVKSRIVKTNERAMSAFLEK